MEDLENSSILARWASGNISEEEKKNLESKYDLRKLSIVLEDLNKWALPTYDKLEKLKEINNLKNKKKQKSPTKMNLRPWLRIAAGILLLLGTYFTYQLFSSANITLSTQMGENITHVLPLGSKVTLDAKSNIKYNRFRWKKSREIALEGQAFFKVSHGQSFKVKTSQGTIEVLGTQFNVLADSKQFEVYCYEGTVKVSTAQKTDTLVKHNGVILKDGKLVPVEVNENTPDWIHGYTKYELTKLYKVVEDIMKYYDVNITLPEKYHDLEFSGIIVHNDLNLALEMVFKPMNISYTITKNNKVIIK